MKNPFVNEVVSFCWAGPNDDDGHLFASEALLVKDAVGVRKREFGLGRSCARCALGKLGVEDQPIHRGSHGEPLWPAGVIGSITHTNGHAFAAAAFQDSTCVSIGVDLEAYLPLNDGVLQMVLTQPELERLIADPADSVYSGLLLFSAKEAIYKAWFPIVPVRVGFEDCDVEWDFKRLAFRGRVIAAGEDLSFDGQWSFPSALDGMVLATVEADSSLREPTEGSSNRSEGPLHSP